MNKNYIISIVIIIASFALGLFYYSSMPMEMASHWNIRGLADGYMPKFWGLFLLPIITLAIFLLFILIPKIDPLKENIKMFRNYYDKFVLVFIVYMTYLYTLTLVWNLGMRFNFIQFIVPAFSVLFYVCGVLIKNAKRNYLIGIRTPWTLHDDYVWDKTHILGGKLFKLCAIVSLSGILFPQQAIFISILPIILVAILLVIYSYFVYKKEHIS